MSEPGYIFDAGYEAGIDSLTADIGKLQGDYDALLERFEKLGKITISLLDKIEDEMLGKAEISVHDVQTLRGKVWALGVDVDD